MVDPRNLSVVRDLEFITNTLLIDACIAPEVEILDAIDRAYGSQRTRDLKDLLETVLEVVEDDAPLSEISREQLERESRQAHNIKLVNWILSEAFNRGASDIHIEPYERECRIRYRINGVLQTIPELALRLNQNTITSRIKIMANLDYASPKRSQQNKRRHHYYGRDFA
jgi:type IV pilus assembly protein PilB